MPPVSVTQEQISTLVEFMERHGDLSFNSKEMRNKFLWVELIGILNQIGVGPQKTLDQWKKTWTDLKYRTKEKTLKNIQKAPSTCDRNTIVLSKLEKRICGIIKNSHSQLEHSNDEFQIIEDQEVCQENDDTADPMFIEFLEQAESLSPVSKAENSPSPSPPLLPITGSKGKRKRHYSHEQNDELYKRQNTSYNSTDNITNVEEENKTLHHRQLIELKRLELETLRETNFHEREKVRAEIEREKHREVLKVQQQFISFLQDIKPALIHFLNK